MSVIAYDLSQLSFESQGILLRECRRFEPHVPRFFGWLAERIAERAAKRTVRPLAWAIKPRPLELPDDLSLAEIERARYFVGCLEEAGRRAIQRLEEAGKKSRILEARRATEFLGATLEALNHAKLRIQIVTKAEE